MTEEISREIQKQSDNPNKIIRIDELHRTKENHYRNAISYAHGTIEGTLSIKDEIRQAAFAWEEIFKLHNQEWMITYVGRTIVRDLKVRGFPESKYKYVYKALNEYQDRFVKGLDHSSVTSVDSYTKDTELFYHTHSQKYYESIAVLQELKKEHHLVPRRDLQVLIPELMDIFDDNEKLAKKEGIPIVTNTQHSFDGGPEKYADPIRIQKPIPRVPEILTEELNIWMKIFLPALLKKYTDYPITDRELEKSMAAGWAALRHAHDPSTDDKYRKSYYDWITIVQFADESFKHHAASKFKTKTFKNHWRKLTREQIGARQKTIPAWTRWFFEKIPGFMEEIAWSRADREPRLSDFSIDLSPKLSDRSIR